MAKNNTKKAAVKTTKEVVDKKPSKDLTKDLKKASKSAAKVAIEFPSQEKIESKVEEVAVEVASEVVAETVAEAVVEAVVEAVAETPTPVKEKSVAEVQQEYVDKVKNQIAEANKAKADWLAKIAEERQVAEAMKAKDEADAKAKAEEEAKAEAEAPKEVVSETTEIPAEVEAAPEMTTQEAILDKYLKTRGSYTDINHYELANTGFDTHALDSNLTCVVGRFTLTRPYVGGYWNVTEKK
jgi:hypothetical protein